MPSNTKTNASYIPTLDGWRALAVTLVVGAHCAPMLVRNGSWPALKLDALLEHAGYGVDIFFALSGFLICSLLLKEKQRTQTISLRRFYLRRAFRILPPMLLYLATVVALSVARVLPTIHVKEVLSVVFFFRNYVAGSWYTGHFWSLAVEEHFYILVPIVLLRLNRKNASVLVGASILACIVVRNIEFMYGQSLGTLLQFRSENRCDGLLWGSLLAIAFSYEGIREKLRQMLSGWVFLGLLLLAVGSLALFSSQPSRRTIVAAILPFLIAHTVLRPQALLGRLLEVAALRWVGRLSYSLYLWQMLFLPEMGKTIGVWQTFPFALIFSVVCAVLSFYLLEKPMIKLGHRFAASPGSAPDVRYR